jgi:TonB-linked SusC/RagA family outer membrane protein
MKQKYWFCLLLLLLIPGVLFAQYGKIRGKIVDQTTNDPLIGANITVEGTNLGAATDIEGSYVIAHVPVGSYTLVARFIGYEQFRQLVTVSDSEVQVIDVKLKASSVLVNPVVVTAIGTKALREQMGTAVSSIDAKEIETAGAHDLISNLAAKAPGINTVESTGDPGASTRIVLRGAHSLMGDNQPLIVIDGVPVLSTTWSTNAGIANSVSNVAAISRIDDINPENIQSVEVYSGPSAASLWGSKAASGVIAITTRNGMASGITANKKLSISVHSTMYSDDLSKELPLQTMFGEGLNGAYAAGQPRSWGDPIWMRSGAADVLADPNNPYSAVVTKNSKQTYDHATELYKSPLSWDNGVTLQGGDEWGDFLLDISNLDQRGIIKENSDYIRNSIRGNAARRFSEDITVRINANYVKTTSNRIQQGSNVSGLALGGYRTPPDFNNDPYLINFVDPVTGAVTPGVQRSFRNPTGDPTNSPGFDNPLYVINKIPTTFDVDRFLGNIDISYDPLKWLNVSYLVGADYYNELRSTVYPVGDAQYPTGYLTREMLSEYMVNTDLRLKATQKVTDDIEGSLLLGVHVDHASQNETFLPGSDFVLPDAPTYIKNTLNYLPDEYQQIVRTAAFYGEANINMFEQLFIHLSGRDESASTYGANADKTYFYPAASIAWQFTKLDALKDNDILSYGKVRLAYGVAAVQPVAYTSKTYYYDAQLGNGWQSGNYNLDGVNYGGAATRGLTLGNANLKPEQTVETEGGVDLRFLNDRLGLNITQYSNKSTDVILPITLPPSSGYVSMYVNGASMKNTGTEVQLIADWLRLGEFSWSTTVNWSKNKNEVTALYPGVQRIDFTGFTGTLSSALVGQPIGVLFGTRWERDANGKMTLDSHGFPILASDPGVIGNPNPDWRSGITNTLKYQRFTVNVVLDIKKGGQVWNGTKGALMSYGVDGSETWWTTISASDAASLYTWSGQHPTQFTNKRFIHNADGTYSFRGYITNFGGGPVIVDQGWFQAGLGNGFNGPAEQFVENGGFVRLREVTLSYTFPLNFVGMKSATLSLTGRNLKLWTDYSGVDPETNLTGPTNGQGLDYFNNPTTKTYIVSLRMEY